MLVLFSVLSVPFMFMLPDLLNTVIDFGNVTFVTNAALDLTLDQGDFSRMTSFSFQVSIK